MSGILEQIKNDEHPSRYNGESSVIKPIGTLTKEIEKLSNVDILTFAIQQNKKKSD